MNINPPKKLKIKENEYIDAIKKTIKFRGEPISVPHENAFLQMSNFMKKDISVVMSGEGLMNYLVGMEEYLEVLMIIICQKNL